MPIDLMNFAPKSDSTPIKSLCILLERFQIGGNNSRGLLRERALQLDRQVQSTIRLQVDPERVVFGLKLMQTDRAVGDELVWRQGRVVKHGKVNNMTRMDIVLKLLIEYRVLIAMLGGRAAYRQVVYVQVDIRR